MCVCVTVIKYDIRKSKKIWYSNVLMIFYIGIHIHIPTI